MASALLALALVASLASSVLSCAVPYGGCRLSVCEKYKGVSVSNVAYPGANYESPATWSQGSLPLIGFYLGKYNPTVNGGGYDRSGPKDTPSLNYERFDLETGVVNPLTGSPYATPHPATTIYDCCVECAKAKGCYLYQFFPEGTPASYATSKCYQLSGGTQTWDFPERGTPYSGSQRRQNTGRRTTIPPSFVGGRCNGTDINDDPHFTGAHGTHFDFNGALDKSFCLISDKTVHINGLFKGYKDTDTHGATVQADGKALRTWIRAVAFLYKDASGTEHKLTMATRDGPEQGKGKGFLSSITFDGVNFPEPTKAGVVVNHLGTTLSFTGTFTRGKFEVDYYKLKIGDSLDMTVTVRVAQPQMQQKDEAQTHFNLLLNDIRTSDAIHGVLGQTFRNSEQQVARAVRFQELSRLLKGPIQADGKTGEGFLEGTMTDYVTSDLTKADCKYSAF